MKMCASTSNMIIKVEKLADNDSQISPLTFDDSVIIISPTLTDKPFKSHFSCGDLNTIKSVFESLIFILFSNHPPPNIS